MTLLLLLSLTTAVLSWDAPTENVDGTPLPKCVDVAEGVDCLDGYTIYYGTAPRVYDQPTIPLDETADTHEVAPSTVGTYFFAITAIDDEGNESAFSNEVSKEIIESLEPLPPVLLLQEEAVFTVKMQPDVFLLFNVGTVPAGTLCDLNSGAPRGYGVVPNAEVVWTSPTGPRPIAVVARCDG